MAFSAKNNNGVSTNASAAVKPATSLEKAVVADAFPDDPMGLIPAKYLFDPIRIHLETIWLAPAQLGETDFVHFSIQPHTPEAPYPLAPIALHGPLTQEDDFPVELTISGNWLLVSGSYDITYYIDGPGGIEHCPFTTTFTVDRDAPGTVPLGPPIFRDDDVTDHGINEEYLRDHSVVEVELPAYTDRKAFDEVLIYFMANIGDRPHEVAFNFIFTTTTEPRIIPIPSHLFRQLENGPRALAYTLRDRAGNQHANASAPVPVFIDLRPGPSGLQIPYVAAFDYNGLIDRADARDQVTVRVDPYFDWAPTDEVSVHWNGEVLGRVTVDRLPKSVTVDWPTLIQHGYLQTRFAVRYFIHRAGSAPGEPSPILRVSADFRVAGQDHALAPQLYNPDLMLLEIRGAVSDTANHLDFSDANQPVTATVELFDDPRVGQEIFLYWGDIEDPVASYRVQPTDLAGEIVEFSKIQWSVVENTPNQTDFPVRYRTSQPTAVGTNEQLSADQAVNISIVRPTILPRPEFTDAPASVNYYLNCKTLPAIWDGVRVRVDKHLSINEGDEIRLKWQGYSGFAGTGPIVGTGQVFRWHWTRADEDRGYYHFIVPYRPYVEPMKDEAGAGAEYSVWRGSMLVGNSTVRYIKLDRVYSRSPTVVYCGPDGNGPE